MPARLAEKARFFSNFELDDGVNLILAGCGDGCLTGVDMMVGSVSRVENSNPLSGLGNSAWVSLDSLASFFSA